MIKKTEFKDKVVLVTGSSQGLGAYLSKKFADYGATVVINYNTNRELAEELLSSLENKGDSIIIGADISKTDQVKSMFEKIHKYYGKLDVLINNAAIYEDSTIWNMSEDTWDNVLSVGLKGVYNCTSQASKLMKSQCSGRIVNISSVVGQTKSFGTSNYAAAKAGIIGFSRVIANELARYNVTVNTVSLGYIEIGMLLRLPQKIRDMILQEIPMRRWGNPSEVFDLVSFLSSDKASYITGEVINLNGGYLMQ